MYATFKDQRKLKDPVNRRPAKQEQSNWWLPLIKVMGSVIFMTDMGLVIFMKIWGQKYL